MKIFQTKAYVELSSPFSSSTMLILLSKWSFWGDEDNFDPIFGCWSSSAKAGLGSGSSQVLQVGFPKLTGSPGTIPISWRAGSKLALQQPFGTSWCSLWKTGGEETDFNHWTSTNWHRLCPNWEKGRIWLWTFQEEKAWIFPPFYKW